MTEIRKIDDKVSEAIITAGDYSAGIYTFGAILHSFSCGGRDVVVGYDDLTPETIASHKIIVNTTPLGMFPHIDQCPDIPYEALTPGHLCYDVVYNPEETLFLQKAAAQGCKTKNGIEMLHRQALAAWEIWNKMQDYPG